MSRDVGFFFSPLVDNSALKINVTWGWGLVLGAMCISFMDS